MKNLTRIIFAILIGLLAFSQASAGTTRKTVKSGEQTLVYQSQFAGVPPGGVKPPEPSMVQPKNGKLTLKKKITGSGRSKITLYSFYYTSKAGYKGKDEAKAIINFYLRMKDGTQSKVPTTNERILLRVR